MPTLPQQCKAATLAAVTALGGTARRADILEHALAHGGFTPEQLALHHDRIEGYLRRSPGWLKKDGALFNVARGVWSTTPAPEPTDEADHRAEYRRYRESPAWQARRAQALEAAGHHCQMDKTHTGRLDVHHNTYDNLGNEQPGDLIVLCSACHMRHHRHEWNARRTAAAPAEPVGPIDVAARHAELAPRRWRWPWSRAA